MPFTFANIRRPNVGKATLFNRLVGQKLALVDDKPGVTRDRREGEGRLGDLNFTLIDTAGLDEGAKGSLTARMQEQTEVAIGLADALMFVVDARAGLTPTDRSFADFARRATKPVVLGAPPPRRPPPPPPLARVSPPPRQQAGGAGRQQERGQAWRCRRDGGLCARPRRADPDFRRTWRGPQRSLRRVARDHAGAIRGVRRVRR